MMHLRRSAFFTSLIVAALIGVALGVFSVGRAEQRWSRQAAVEAPILPVQMPLTTGTFAKVAEAIRPAVINVTTVGRGGEGRGSGRTPFEEFFGEEFFRRFFGELPERMPQRSLGSGVIVDASGIALTNAHVVENANNIEVVTLDGNKHRAKLVGLDKKTDLAVLKLDDGKGSFPHARLGDSDKM
jgi:serine protease Do